MSRASATGKRWSVDDPQTPKSALSNAEKKQREACLERMVKKRGDDISAIRNAHRSASSRWAGTVTIRTADIDAIYVDAEGDSRKRLERWVVLGTSLATLLQLPDTTAYVHRLAQVMEEYEYYISSATVQSMKMMSAAMGGDSNPAGQVRPRVRKHMRHLQTQRIAFALDPRQVVVTFSDVLACTYRRFVDPVCEEKQLFEAILKIDQQFASHFIAHLGTCLTQVASTVAQREIGSLAALLKTVSTPDPQAQLQPAAVLLGAVTPSQ